MQTAMSSQQFNPCLSYENQPGLTLTVMSRWNSSALMMFLWPSLSTCSKALSKSVCGVRFLTITKASMCLHKSLPFHTSPAHKS